MASNSEIDKSWSNEEKKVKKLNQPKILRLLPFAIAFLASFPYLVYTEKIILAPNVNPNELKDFSAKLQFTFKYQILGVIWLIFSMWYVISKRFPSPAVNPMSGYEHLAEGAKNILTNSIEQFFMSVIAQLSILSYLDESETLKLIPMMNVMYLIGRVTFWLGYPENRSFGFWVSMWPTQIISWMALSRFMNFAFGCSSALISWGIPLSFYTGWYIVLRIHRHKRF